MSVDDAHQLLARHAPIFSLAIAALAVALWAYFVITWRRPW